MSEIPVALDAGVSRNRDRMWRLIGGVLGVAVVLGSAAIAVFVEGADPRRRPRPTPRSSRSVSFLPTTTSG